MMAAAIGELSSEENMLSVFFHVLASPIVYFYSIPTPKILNGADSIDGTSAPLGCCSNCLSSLGKSSQICPVMRCSRHLSFQSPWPSRLTITHLTSPGNGLVMCREVGPCWGHPVPLFPSQMSRAVCSWYCWDSQPPADPSQSHKAAS